MSIIETIRAEVERRKKKAEYYIEVCKADSRAFEYWSGERDVLELFEKEFLSTLQEKSEKPTNPVCEDVERELERFLIEDVDVIVNEDTEKVRIFDVDTGKGDIDITYSDLKNLARHFAQWQKEQMMKEAVEGWVAVDSDTAGNRRVTFFQKEPVRDLLTEYKYWAATRPNYESVRLNPNAFPNLKWEDEPKNVKLIIVKEEEK